jgi:hypothetical protein
MCILSNFLLGLAKFFQWVSSEDMSFSLLTRGRREPQRLSSEYNNVQIRLSSEYNNVQIEYHGKEFRFRLAFVLHFRHTNSNDATPKLVVSMANYQHETYDEMCRRTDAWLAAFEASAFTSRDNEHESYDNEIADMEAAEAAQQNKEKEETPTEIWKRIMHQKEAKSVKSVKTAAKKSVKQKRIKKMTAHFPRN